MHLPLVNFHLDPSQNHGVLQTKNCANGRIMIVRLCKTLMVVLLGLFFGLVAYNNVVDPNTNLAYVQHVLSMDTIFAGHPLSPRAITDPRLHQLAYTAIIATEFIAALLCFAGAAKLFFAIRRSPSVFNKAKSLAVLGMVLGFALWFFGFMTVGAEWFLMWQSPSWNGQNAAFRTLACIGIALLFVNQREVD